MTKNYLYNKLPSANSVFWLHITHSTVLCEREGSKKSDIKRKRELLREKSLVHTWIFLRRRSTPYYYFFLFFFIFVWKEELFLLWNYFCIHKYMLYLQYIDTNKHVQCTYYILTLHVCLVIQNHKRAQCLLSTHEKI